MGINLRYRPPYDWERLLAFLGARSITGVESVSESSYRRIARIGQTTGWVEVTPGARTLRVSVSPSLEESVDAVRERVTHLFDLSADPARVAAVLGTLAAARPGLRLPGAFDGFEVAVRAVLGQQVSVAAARTLAGRFAAALGTKVRSPFPELSTAFPTPARVARASAGQLTTLGILPSRANTILELAKTVAGGTLRLEPGVDAEATMAQLRTIRGIGEWTAQYIAMRALAWPDAFPHTDLGVMKALGERNPRRVLALAEKWRPWRAYAVMHLWAS